MIDVSDELIFKYQKTGDPNIANQLLDLHKNYIQSNINKWSGIIPQSVIDSYGRHYALNAFKTFVPNSASINTHLYNHISQLSRHIYEAQNVIKIPEHQIQMIGKVNQAKEYLIDTLNRDPTIDEIADHLALPKQHIAKVIKNQRADFLNDSDTEMQIATNNNDISIGNRIFSYRQSLDDDKKEQFDALTGFGGKQALSPKEFGKTFNLQPYQVSRLKSYFAKGLK